MIKRTWSATLLAGWILAGPLGAPALAEAPARQAGAEVESSSPTTGSRIPGAPPVVTLRMTTPVESATVTVTDGCGQEVPSDVRVVGTRVSVRLSVGHAAAGHPDHTSAGGTWRVAWRAAEATGDLLFAVTGETNCFQEPVVAAAKPAENPWFLRILLAVAGTGIFLTILRLWQRSASPTPDRST